MNGEVEPLTLDDGVCETVKGETEPLTLLDGDCETVSRGEAGASLTTAMTAAPSPPI